MRIFRLLLPLLALLTWSAAAQAQDDSGGQYTLTTRCIPEEGGWSEPGSSTHDADDSVNVWCGSHSGFRFVQWEDESGNLVSESSDFHYTMPARNVTFIARFEYDPGLPPEPSESVIAKYAIVHVEASPSEAAYFNVYNNAYGDGVPTAKEHEWVFTVGSSAHFQPMPHPGFHFKYWTENGEVVSTEGEQYFTVEEGGRHLVAHFEYDPGTPSEPESPVVFRRLTLKSNPENAASSLHGAGEYPEGEEVNVRGNANENYVFENWTDDLGNVVSNAFDFNYTVPARHVTLTANFRYEFNPGTPEEPGSPDNDDHGVAARPRLSMYDDTHVLMLSSTAGATIHYTLDGSEPTASSSVYTEPVFVPSNLVVKAMAVKAGLENSTVTTYQVTAYHAEAPEFTFRNYRVEISSATPGATIRYTIGRNDPTETSTLYQEPLELNDGAVLKAIAYAEGLSPSEVRNFVFQRSKYLVEAPVLSMNSEGRLVIVPAVEGSTIRYTTDGTLPNTESAVYTAPLALDGNLTVKAYTTHPGYFDSPVGQYVLSGFRVEPPVLTFVNRAVVMTVPTAGASIRYTLDGSVPTESSALYSEPLALTEDRTVTAMGYKANYDPSDAVSYSFIYVDHQVARPEVSYDPDSRTVTMSSPTENASIRYTTDGSVPTATTGTAYTAPFVVEGNKTFTVRAFRSDMFDSGTVMLVVNDQSVPTPTATFADRRLTLSCADPEAAIYYTVDGSEPTAASTRYTAPIELTEDRHVRFVGIREGYNNSSMAEYWFVYADHQVAKPEVTYDPATVTVTMTSATEGASIRYTTDGSVPTATTGTAYSAPVTVDGNQTYTVRAFRDDLFDSETATLTINDQTVPTPTSSFAALRLTLSCSDTNAEIHYTTDGSTPTASSTLYTEPLALTYDCTVRFIAVRAGYNNSEVASFEFRKSSYQVAIPAMNYDPDTKVLTMSCATQGAVIRYTTDGSVPTATTGSVYSAPITVEGNHTYTAVAFAEGLFDSEVAVLEINSQKVPTPTASFANKVLTLTCPDASAAIHYTTDGSTPTASSTLYSVPVALTGDCTVLFIAVRDEYKDSDVASFEFRRADHTVARPAISYDSARSRVTISCATQGASIRYTTDGSVPTATTGTAYTEPFAVSGNQTITAVAFAEGLFDSEVATLTISDQTVPTPTASFANRQLTLSCSDANAEIHYTTDGSVPTASSTLYSGPVALTGDCTVRFIAVRSGYNDSEVASFEFRKASYQASTPAMNYDPDTKVLTMSCATQGAVIRYTTDGSVPTGTAGSVYSAPITVEGNHTYTAVAFVEGLFDSEVAVLEINSQKVPTPTAAFANKVLTLTCPDASAAIHYTIDGSTPTASSTLYSVPVALTGDCTVLFIAVRDEYKDSDVASFEFRRADHTVARPAISYDSARSRVTISCATQGASIRYTTDGSVPTATTGTAYTEPFAVNGNQTITAVAFAEGLFDSEAATLTISDQTVPTPTASFANRQLTLTCSDVNAEIHYTLDGSMPTASSTLYSGPISLTGDCTVRFIAIREGYNDSEVASFEFRKASYQAATPAMNYDPDTKVLTMSCSTEGAVIRYTTDGSVPTATTGSVYSAPITVEGNHTYTAVAFAEGLFDSEVAVLEIDSQRVPTPTAGFANKVLTLTCADANAEIHYTTDGSTPTVSSTHYTGPVALTQDCTVLFIAVREGYKDSNVASFEFRRADHTVARPAISYDSARSRVTISCATQGASIRYTTDGSVPTATTGTAYTEPFTVSGNQTITAVAFADGLFDSEAATLTINDQTVPTPTASFANRQLTLTCSDGDAEIHYTLDGSMPTASSTLYSGPISLTGDCTVRFIAVRSGYNDSDVASFEFRRTDYTVASPAISYDSARSMVTITCATQGAQIRYSTDGSVPTATTGTVYTAPFTVSGNQTITAVAFAEGLFDSEVATLTIGDQKVATPTASFANRQLTLTCSDGNAEIHYTTDGSTPTSASTLYSGPVALTEDCTVRFIAVREGYNDSDVASFDFRRSRYQVARPVMNYDTDSKTLTITCPTEGAVIRYTTDGSVPTATSGTAYTEPIAVNGNMTFTAMAFADGLFDSEATTLSIDNQKVPTPTATFADRVLTLNCADSRAEIHYTTDGSTPTASSALYTEPLSLTEDCTVRFIAIREGYNDSDVVSFELRTADHTEAVPVLTPDYRGRTVEVTQADRLPVLVTIDGSSETMQTPATINVEPGMKSIRALTVASDGNRFDSEATQLDIVFHSAPVLDYDGHSLSYAPAKEEADTLHAQAYIYLDGNLHRYGQAEGTLDIFEFADASAVIESDHAFRSEETFLPLDYFNSGRRAGARNGHRLSEGFGTWGDNPADYTFLEVTGEVEKEDLEFLGSLPELTTLHLAPTSMTAERCDGVLAGSRIETIFSPAYPEGMLKEMPRLTTLFWAGAGQMPEGRIAEAGNPNILVWVAEEDSAPADALNVVSYDYIGGTIPTDPEKEGIEGSARRISLQAGYPFNAHMPVHAERVELTKRFSLTTLIGGCSGWETIILPFDAEGIVHETAGEIVPFSGWSGADDQRKPFWLYKAEASGWVATAEMEAGIPYMISMPNSTEYAAEYNLAGNVTFIATDVTLGTEDSMPKTENVSGYGFVGTFMPVEEAGIRSLNVNAVATGDEDMPGSAFVENDVTLPFGAYISGDDLPKRIPVFGDWTGVMAPMADADGVTVETPAPGMLRISSGRDCNVSVTTATGVTVRTLRLKAGEAVTLEGLTRDLYIVAGRKVMVR